MRGKEEGGGRGGGGGKAGEKAILGSISTAIEDCLPASATSSHNLRTNILGIIIRNEGPAIDLFVRSVIHIAFCCLIPAPLLPAASCYSMQHAVTSKYPHRFLSPKVFRVTSTLVSISRPK